MCVLFLVYNCTDVDRFGIVLSEPFPYMMKYIILCGAYSVYRRLNSLIESIDPKILVMSGSCLDVGGEVINFFFFPMPGEYCGDKFGTAGEVKTQLFLRLVVL